ERVPAAAVLDVRIRAALEQVGAELVVAVLRGDEQRAPAVFAGLVHVRAGIEQDLHRIEVAFARREQQRRESAPLLLAALGIGRRLREARDRRLRRGDLLVELFLRFLLLLRLVFLALGIRRVRLVLLEDGAAQAGAVDELL